MMVLFTAYLNDGEPFAGDDSDIKARRMEFWGGLEDGLCGGHGTDRTDDDCCVPGLGARVLVEVDAAQGILAGLGLG